MQSQFCIIIVAFYCDVHIDLFRFPWTLYKVADPLARVRSACGSAHTTWMDEWVYNQKGRGRMKGREKSGRGRRIKIASKTFYNWPAKHSPTYTNLHSPTHIDTHTHREKCIQWMKCEREGGRAAGLPKDVERLLCCLPKDTVELQGGAALDELLPGALAVGPPAGGHGLPLLVALALHHDLGKGLWNFKQIINLWNLNRTSDFEI